MLAILPGQSLNNMNLYSIIGGSGFIGTRLCKRLNDGGKPFHILDKEVSYFYPEHYKFANVSNLSSLRDSIVDEGVIVNLAAEHRDDVRPLTLYQEVNVEGAKNICTVAREKNIQKIIFTSSVAVYGFAIIGTGEKGVIQPFNEYGRTKYEAENVFIDWQSEDPAGRTLVIVRPSVVFGERNRGNVYNLLKQIASGKFIMVGSGQNRKSIAYVENVAAVLEYSLTFKPGVHTYNYVDKPDFTMNNLVQKVNHLLGKTTKNWFRLPYSIGYFIGKCFDWVSLITNKRFPISAIRVKKFCANSVYNTAIHDSGFSPHVSLEKALEKTVCYEFLESHTNEHLFFSE
jgi:nucleoside-diphosphate-sugar epimerase